LQGISVLVSSVWRRRRVTMRLGVLAMAVFRD
jgi:hypothetical protein